MDFEFIGKIAERKIQEAIEEGKFDNLPGKGKPIVFEEDSTTPAHLRMANKVLKNAGVLPDWIQIQRDILDERVVCEKLSARLIQENKIRRFHLSGLPADHHSHQDFAVWHSRSRASYLRHLKSVNTSILKFNLMAPTNATAYKPYNVEKEMELFDADFPILHAPSPDVSAETTEAENSELKKLARDRYQSGGGTLRGWLKGAKLFGQSSARFSPENEDANLSLRENE